MEAHLGVEIISRDRCSEYIKGATDGAPDAIQVADRWHLLTNLRDMMKRLIEGKRACLEAASGKPKQKESNDHGEQTDNSPVMGKKEKEKLTRRDKR